eukprot:2386418-Alexandrium_andersonii.AAC.1
MSASLVGSEMCIRDSVLPRPSLSLQVGVATAEGRGPSRITMSCAARAVSYTHLTLPTICSV